MFSSSLADCLADRQVSEPNVGLPVADANDECAEPVDMDFMLLVGIMLLHDNVCFGGLSCRWVPDTFSFLVKPRRSDPHKNVNLEAMDVCKQSYNACHLREQDWLDHHRHANLFLLFVQTFMHSKFTCCMLRSEHMGSPNPCASSCLDGLFDMPEMLQDFCANHRALWFNFLIHPETAAEELRMSVWLIEGTRLSWSAHYYYPEACVCWSTLRDIEACAMRL